MIKLSDRAKAMPASPIRKLVPLADEAKKRGVKVYHLNIGQPDIVTPKEFMQYVIEQAPKVISYTHSEGIHECINAMIDYYKTVNISLERKNVQITMGGSEAITFAMTAVTNPGDEVIVFEPFYTNYNGFATMLGVKLVPITTYAEDGYHFPAKEEIEKHITDKTRAIMICNPNNPTGTVFERNEIETIVEIAQKRDLFVFSDEVYREFIYDGLKHTSIMDFPEIKDRAIMLDSLSKRYSLCGARIGCLVSYNTDIMQAALRMGQARLSSPTLEQIGAIGALKLPASYYKEVIDEYESRRNSSYERLLKIKGVMCKEPKGAFYIFIKMPIKDSSHFATYLLNEFNYEGETVMVAPGDGFYASKGLGYDEIRIAYVLKKEDMVKSIDLLDKGIEKYKIDYPNMVS